MKCNEKETQIRWNQLEKKKEIRKRMISSKIDGNKADEEVKEVEKKR